MKLCIFALTGPTNLPQLRFMKDALIPVRLLDSLNEFLDSGDRKIDRWYAKHTMALANFADKPDTFFNINTPNDQHRLEQESMMA